MTENGEMHKNRVHSVFLNAGGIRGIMIAQSAIQPGFRAAPAVRRLYRQATAREVNAAAQRILLSARGIMIAQSAIQPGLRSKCRLRRTNNRRVQHMSEKTEMSRQQQKSMETKEKIFQAAKRILQKKGYEELSIKNICEEAGVSNGSFYHHFRTKDDLLSYYIEDQPTINPDLLELPENAAGVKEGIIQVYLNYVKYCRELGVEFMSGYYDTKNQALNAAIRTERPYPIVTVQTYVEKAIAAGVVRLNVEIEEFTTDIRMIVIGNVFEWCLRKGEADFEGNMSRSLGRYLDSTLCEGQQYEHKI